MTLFNVGSIIELKRDKQRVKIRDIDRVFEEDNQIKVAIAYTWSSDDFPYAVWPDDFIVLEI